ncbi:molybdopterin converting factor small subunit [Actinoplanes octamycinicus]|uniref:Molybdopterin converting factor small subunit n=1 Tax=Actinoplanes octamycinicus TaxID=135948 RepID=A0A7W7GTN7_9ACTN|nr:MoaD/ThiS family protein [Actinoplanes octamycinicus]MBB4738068.1 molybdopterin converting factor small subunit [Actinoplanes octamycinicus]GIE59379.1 putative molybdenum cofactor biosynthesis protein D2 (MoaD2) / thiamineS [Actinoplanes octamycinicus]
MLTVRYFAGARAAAGGVTSEEIAAGSLEELARVLTDRHGERLGLVMKAASFLVDGLTCHDRRAVLPAGATVDVLPPFAGG